MSATELATGPKRGSRSCMANVQRLADLRRSGPGLLRGDISHGRGLTIRDSQCLAGASSQEWSGGVLQPALEARQRGTQSRRQPLPLAFGVTETFNDLSSLC